VSIKISDQPHSQRQVRGHIKWFDPAKGYGFVATDNGGPDILLHANVLRNYGQSSVVDGVGINIEVTETDRGAQAVAVLSLDELVPELPSSIGDFENLTPEDLAAIPVEPARVKWFDKAKGFGFANVFGSDDDIFVHLEVVRQAGLADLVVGEAVCLQVIVGERGKMAASLRGWEAPLRSP